MARLKAARMTDTTLVSQFDDFLGQLEADLAAIFGYDLDEDVTESAFSIDNSGRITKAMPRFVAALDLEGDTVAFQITNTSNSNVALAGLALLQDDSTRDQDILPFLAFGDAGTPTDDGDGFFALNLSDVDVSGYFGVKGAFFSSSAAGMIRRGSGNVNEYLRSDGVFTDPFTTFDHELCVVNAPSDAGGGGQQDFTADVTETPIWTTETLDPNTLHSASDDEIIIETAGKYLVGCQVEMDDFTNDDGVFRVRIIRDRSAVLTVLAQSNMKIESGASASTAIISVDALDSCEVGDKLKVQLLYETGAGGKYACSPVTESNHFFALRVA